MQKNRIPTYTKNSPRPLVYDVADKKADWSIVWAILPVIALLKVIPKPHKNSEMENKLLLSLCKVISFNNISNKTKPIRIFKNNPVFLTFLLKSAKK